MFKKIVLAFAGLAVLLAVVLMVWFQHATRDNQIEVWQANWAFVTPPEQRKITVFEHIGRDPDQYVIVDYSGEAVEELRRRNAWHSAGVPGAVQAHVASFQSLMKELHSGEAQVLAVLDAEHGRLYVMEVFF